MSEEHTRISSRRPEAPSLHSRNYWLETAASIKPYQAIRISRPLKFPSPNTTPFGTKTIAKYSILPKVMSSLRGSALDFEGLAVEASRDLITCWRPKTQFQQ